MGAKPPSAAESEGRLWVSMRKVRDEHMFAARAPTTDMWLQHIGIADSSGEGFVTLPN